MKRINLEGMMRECGVFVDHSTINCKVGIDDVNEDRGFQIHIRQIKFLNNIVEQAHRNIKRIINPMMNFKSVSLNVKLYICDREN